MKIPSRAYLLTGIIIFSASSSVIRKLSDIGSQHLIDGRNPIQFCNILFIGNLLAVIILNFIYYPLPLSSIKNLTWSDWLGLLTVAILEGAVAPTLIFLALENTNINNVILISRLEPPLSLTLSVLLLGETINLWVINGAIISFLGVLLTIWLNASSNEVMQLGMGFSLGKGELMIIGWSISIAISTIINKVKLKQIHLGFFTIFKTTIGTIVFFIVALKLFGVKHFADSFTPVLWQWMLFYSLIIVVGGQLAWFNGLKQSNASDVSLASSTGPVAGILAAYFILNEIPNSAQIIGSLVIMLGIILNQIGIMRQTTPTTDICPNQIDKMSGFKGI